MAGKGTIKKETHSIPIFCHLEKLFMALFSKKISQLCIITLLVSTLTSCAAVVIGGAAATGNTLANRRTVGAISDDNVMGARIHTKAIEELNKLHKQSKNKPTLSIISYNRQILLLGQVPSESDRMLVENIAKQESAAEKIFNYIEITNQYRTASNVSSDTWLTSKLRTRLLNISNVYAGHVKVVTFNGVVYAMGILTPEQQNAVTEVIRTTPGVQKVVTLYENYE